MILKPEAFHVARSFRRHLNHFSGHVTFNQDFESVITQCAAPRQGREETWITNEMKAAYIHLHRLGIAHSIEIHDQNQLIGGLYGINLGKVFFAESMFSARSGGSKLALYSLCQKLKERGGVLIDCQVYSPHLATLGAVEISRSEFIQKLRTHVHLPPCLLD
jgi:leucyl/phenylalanyl-tRNA--protein transferase